MKRFLLPIVLLATAQLATAGLVVVEEMEQSGGPMPGKTEMTLSVSGDKARVDIGKQISSIVNSKTGATVSLIHAQKVAMELPEGTFDAIKKSASQGEKPKLDLKPTGKKETINGFACEEYTGKINGMDVAFWVTQEVKEQKETLDQISKLMGGDATFQGALANGEAFPGFPIRTVMKTPQAGKMTLTVVSVKSEDVPDSTFEVPAGYRTMNMPKMQLPGGGAPAVPSGPDKK
ncbi:MAG: DUF4412 domain-containing protein [Chthoniobacterales bacterium]